MDININKDITKIQESIILGLPLRETVFGAIALVVGFTTHMYLKNNYEGDESIALITGLVSTPFVLMGFVKYQGLTAEKLIVELIRSWFLPKAVVLEPENIYGQRLRKMRELKQKEVLKNDKLSKKELAKKEEERKKK